MKKLFVIDGNSLINRAFYAIPLLTTHDGVYSNAVFGFVNCITKLITENKPDYFVVAFDHARKTFRNQIYEAYKGTRKPMPTELRGQFEILKNILDHMQITYIEKNGIEADDIIGSVVARSGCENYIITGDRDCLQLVSEHTHLWLTQKGITEVKEVNLNNIKELYGLNPEEVVIFKALAGDAGDNIPGVPGIGEKGAKNLINQFGTIDEIYKNLDQVKGKVRENLVNGRELCYISKELGQIKTDLDLDINIEDCTYLFPYSPEVKKLFEKYNFSSLLRRASLFDANIEEKKVDYPKVEIVSKEDVNLIKLENLEYISLFEDKNGLQIFANETIFNVEKTLKTDEEFKDFLLYIGNYLSCIACDEKVLKIMQNIKHFMHLLGIENFKNAFDLSIASHITSGGLRPDEFNDISEFFDLYKEFHQKLIDKNLYTYYQTIELPLINVLYQMEKDGFMINRDHLKEIYESLENEIQKITESILEFTENKKLNINSPKQVSEFLFNELKITDKGNKKHSTSAEALAIIEKEHPVIPLILRYRKLTKIFFTYVQPYDVLSEKDPLIHTVFNQTQTITGRLSSSDPNLQNIPVRDEEGRVLRKLFVSKFENGSLVSADYNQIELRLLANFSKDDRLIADYKSGKDIHKLTASQIFNIPLVDVEDHHRRTAKAVNFGIVYGISSYGLSKNIDVPVKEAQTYIDLYFSRYIGVKHYLDKLIRNATEDGLVKTLFGRYRDVLELRSNNYNSRLLGERIAMNTPIQGSASDIIKIAMINVYNRLKKENLNSRLILQIHDELIIDTYPGEEEAVKTILAEEMKNVYNFEVPLEVSIGEGKTLLDCK